VRDLGDALRATDRNSEAEAGWREALTICEAQMSLPTIGQRIGVRDPHQIEEVPYRCIPRPRRPPLRMGRRSGPDTERYQGRWYA